MYFRSRKDSRRLYVSGLDNSMMVVPLTMQEDIRKEAVQFGTCEFKCLGGIQVGHWMYRSGTQKKLVGNIIYKPMHCKHVVEPMRMDR